MKPYATLREKTIWGIIEVINFITREREIDVRDWNNLTQTYIRGRKVSKIPTSSTDVTDLDKVNDFNWDISYIYILVDNAGTAEWRRASLGSF